MKCAISMLPFQVYFLYYVSFYHQGGLHLWLVLLYVTAGWPL